MKFTEFGDGRVQTFISHCIDLFRYLKENDKDSINQEQEFLLDRIENIWSSNLQVIKKRQSELLKIMQPEFWNNLTFSDIDFLIREIAPLMKYYEPERKKIIQIDAPDFTRGVESFKMEVKENPNLEYLRNTPLMKKMAKEGVTWKELIDIEKTLTQINPMWTIENIQKREDFVVFLRKILELKDLPDPQELIKQHFEKLIVENNQDFTTEQIHFLRLIEKFFAYNKHLTPKDLTSHPLADENPFDKFSHSELKNIISVVEKIKIK
jgi:type I restriction enzyme R subunit